MHISGFLLHLMIDADDYYLNTEEVQENDRQPDKVNATYGTVLTVQYIVTSYK